MAITRKIYTNSTVEIAAEHVDLEGGSASGEKLYAKPDTVQNATYTLTIPRADVNAFGVKGVVARPRLEAESANIEFSFIPEIGAGAANTSQLEDAGGSDTPENDPATAKLSEMDINAMMHDTLANSPKYVAVQVLEVGQIRNALMTSFSADASVGAMPTMTLSFLGAQASGGQHAFFNASATGAGSSEAGLTSAPAAAAISVVEPQHVFATTPTGHGCVQSLAWAWDIPVELVLCLGADPADEGEALSSPPGTASMTLEGLQEVSDTNALAIRTTSNIGSYLFDIGQGQIDSRTSNMAVGELFATYNYVIGSTADSCNIK